MKGNIEKFVFLGVMLAVTFLFGHRSEGGISNKRPEGTKAVVLSFGNSGSINEQNLEIDTRTSTLISEPAIPGWSETSSFENEEPKKEIVQNSVLDSVREPILREPEAKAIPLQGAFHRTGEGSPGDIDATMVLVSDLKSGENYFNKEDERRWPMASLSKLMTAVVVLKNMSRDQEVSVETKDLGFLDGASRLKVGEKYSAFDLLEIMLSISSNEAAEVLANSYGHSKFIEAMNRQAEEWGLKNTHFDDPTGISVSNQSSAKDLENLARNIFESYPEIFQITRRSQVAAKELGSGKILSFSSNNNFAGKSYFLGGKTGYTEEANGNLLSLFSYGGRPVLVVVLGSSDRFGATEKLYNWFKNNYRI